MSSQDRIDPPAAARAWVPHVLRSLRPTLLIAGDDAAVRSVLGAELSDSFLIVAIAGDASEAIALAERHRPDAALLDIEIAGGGARAAVPEIDARSPETCMVILSGDEPHNVLAEIVGAGATSYVRKGVGTLRLVNALTDALALKTGSAGVRRTASERQLSSSTS
ncbi:MAG TPA: response regulator [Solirubrobacteraceae bacterium]|jgi:DNA-binding NarL/FixJ family response regulator|nr:response regulator [Solirubrobacteraceae bacterium]